jgi:tricorn protease
VLRFRIEFVRQLPVMGRHVALVAVGGSLLLQPGLLDAQSVSAAGARGQAPSVTGQPSVPARLVTAENAGTRLLRRPTVSHELIAFEYGGDLWVVSRNGGDARRLTSTPSAETDPQFSPDGSRITYTSTIAGNTDVYMISAAGGQPTRLTYHPAVDYVRGWTSDGRRVIFASSRNTITPGANSYFRLWTVSADGGMPEALPMPRAFTGSYSPDGKRMAYQPLSVGLLAASWSENQSSQWRRYRGGRTQPIRLFDLSNYSEQKLPWKDSNDTDPMWVGNTVYFLSDRDNTVNLYSYNLDSKQLNQLTHHHDYDIMSASASSDAIVYEQAGYIHLLDLKSGQSRQLVVNVTGDFPWEQPQMKKVGTMITDASLSPTGTRAVFEAHGDIYTLSAEGSDYNNITHSSGAHDRSAVWSPDGERIAWLSDGSGEYQLMIGDQRGTIKPRAIVLPSQAFFSVPIWSPDGKQILLRDSGVNLWTVDLATGNFTKIATDTYDEPGRGFDAAWSPDSRWVAYTKALRNHLRSVFLYSLSAAKSYQLGDGLADAITPAFDASGKYLYFLASTNFALNTGWVDMSAMERPYTRSIYLVVLGAHDSSPLLPEAHDEPGEEAHVRTPRSAAAPGGAQSARDSASMRDRRATRDTTATQPDVPAAPPMHVDVEGINQRIVAINVPPGEYSSLTAGAAGTFLYAASAGEGGRARQSLGVNEYQLKTRKSVPLLEGIQSYSLSADRKKLLYRAGGTRWGIVSIDRPAKVGDGAINVAQVETMVDPREEWNEIFRETWRIEREFFYDAKMHGNDWQAIYDKYSPMLPYVHHRVDLGYLIASVGGELTVGHSYLSGEGDVPDTAHVSVGLLGADYSIENGRYRIKHIYSGGNWNPELHAPLAEPGLRVAEGDYILEVDGRPLAASSNLYSLFVGTAGRPTTIRVGSNPDGSGSRLVTVVPLASDDPIRLQAWIDGNRSVVDKLSGGRLAYVWLPNTSTGGYTAFNRYFYAQQEKQGAIIDDRYNQGGAVADYVISELSRPLMGSFAERAGDTFSMPMVGIYGPKVMVINESGGSGGDALPYYFHKAGIGPLVGKRTWGGLVGTLGVPATIDGGGITSPDLAFYSVDGKWAVENEGIAPDIDVENTAAELINGHDAQLEAAVREALKLLAEHPYSHTPRPAPINRVTPGNSTPQ